MRTWTLLGLAAVTACGGSADARTGVEERDSSGVVVVEHSTIPATELRIPAEPILVIGSAEGAEAYQLHNVQGLAHFSDGRLAVAHASHVVNIYDSDGRYVRTVGREGSGPGEFRRIGYMRRIHGDSLLIHDGAARRVTIFGPELTDDPREYPLPQLEGRIPTVASAGADGTLLLRRAIGPPPAGNGLVRDTLEFGLLEGDTLAPLRTYRGPEMNISIRESGGAIQSISLMQVPFARLAYATAAGERFVTGNSERFELHLWDGAGGLERIVRSTHVAAQPVTDELFAQYVEAELERRAARTVNAFDPAEARRQIEALPRADAVPLFASVIGADDGGFWVREYSVSDDGRWIVFDADGRATGYVRLPPAFRPMLVERDVVFGVERDELDVESVRAYRIEG